MKSSKVIKALRGKEMELKEASVFEVPRSTLKGKVKDKETDRGLTECFLH